MSFKCKTCNEYFPVKTYVKHVAAHRNNSPIPPQEAVFTSLTHKEVLEYYQLFPDTIEANMSFLLREFSVGKGRIDLILRDRDKNLCLIEVAHRSGRSRSYWEEKLRKYRNLLMRVAGLFGLNESTYTRKVRLLLVYPGRKVDEVS